MKIDKEEVRNYIDWYIKAYNYSKVLNLRFQSFIWLLAIYVNTTPDNDEIIIREMISYIDLADKINAWSIYTPLIDNGFIEKRIVNRVSRYLSLTPLGEKAVKDFLK